MNSKYSLITVTLLLLLGCKQGGKEATAQTGKVVIDKIDKAIPKYEDLAGNPVALSDYKGKKVLLNYWATWCRPCLEEMPSLLKAQTILSKENYVFLLASDQSVAIIKDFKAKKGYDFNFIKFNGSLAAEQINALPATFIYNEAGEKVETILGGVEWDGAEMIEKLKGLK